MDKIEIKKPIDRLQQMRNYYERNKEKMKKQIIEAQKVRVVTDEQKAKKFEKEREKTLDKLNMNGYTRIPMKKMEKYNIEYSEVFECYV
jgi:hypothetical protein